MTPPLELLFPVRCGSQLFCIDLVAVRSIDLSPTNSTFIKVQQKSLYIMFCKGMVKGPVKDLIHMPHEEEEEEASEIARRFEATQFNL